MPDLANRLRWLDRRVRPLLPARLIRAGVPPVARVRQLQREHRGAVRRSLQRRRGQHHGQVTVVVTSFNDGRFLDDCLWSIRRQSYGDWRCIIVDDASTDDSVAIAAQHMRDDARVELVRHGVNAGLGAARNTGLLKVTSPWVCFLDADDFLLEASFSDRIETLARVKDRKDIAGSFSGAVTVGEEARPGEFPQRLPGEVAAFEDLLTTAGACPFPAHAPLLRTETLVAAGGFDEDMRSGAEDWDAWLRLMRSGYQFVGSGARTVAYRMRRSSMVGRDPEQHLLVGFGLLHSVHEPADPSTLVPGGPAALSEPLAGHIRDLERARRLVSFAPLIAANDPDRARQLIEEVPHSAWVLLERREDIDARIAAASRRAEQIHPLGADAAAIGRLVSGWVNDARRSPPPVVGADPQDLDELVVASNAAEVAALTPDHASSVWLVLDREEGNQGVGEAVRAQRFETLTLSEFVLGERWQRPTKFITGDRPLATAARLARSGAAGDVGLAGVAMASIEEYPQWPCDATAIAELADIHQGERAVIIGNGPSLRQTDLACLKNELTFGVNGIFYARKAMGFDPTYYVVEDTSVMRENLPAIRRQKARGKFFPSMYRELYADDDAVFFNLNRGFYEQRSPNVGIPRFSVDAAQRIYAGQSVTYVNLQLAYYMGFTSVVLVGVDFDYVIPADAEVEGELITSRGPDPNHFHPDYFGAGKTWKDPRLDRVAQNYRLARDMFEADGREIINATVGGKLEIFPRSDLEMVVGGR